MLRIGPALAVAALVAYAAQSTWTVWGSSADAFFQTYVYNGLVLVGALLVVARVVMVRLERAAWAVLAFGLLAWAAAYPTAAVGREQAQRLFADSVPVAFLYHARGLQGMSRRVRGVTMDVRGELPTVHDWWVQP